MTSPAPVPPDAPPPAAPGHPYRLPPNFGDPAAEYRELQFGAVFFDRSARGRMTFAGTKARDVLSGLVTNDVASLAPGHGHYAAALTPRGKIIADVRVYVTESDVLVDVPPLAWPGWHDMIRKFVNPRLSRYVDRSTEMGQLAVFGPRAPEIVATVTGVAPAVLGALPMYGHLRAGEGADTPRVARVPDGGSVDGFEIFVPASAIAVLGVTLESSGAIRAGGDVLDAMRIEAGRPEWGIDIDDATLVQEANFDELHAVSYTKGCYTGQETVARVHFRGHVNRQLRGLQFQRAQTVPRGALLSDAEGKALGDVRSTACSPVHGGIALAMVRREIEPGRLLQASWDANASEVTVLALPFQR